MNPKKVILHCSATPDYPEHHDKFDSIGVAEIRQWHTEKPPKGNGWKDVGYHFIIRRTGKIEPGRHLSEAGAHVKGHNKDSVGVCYVGTKVPTPEQLKSIVIISKAIKKKYGIDYMNWFGHNDFTTKKTCPGFAINLVREILRLGQASNDERSA
jgi:hypothetical protein